MTVWWATTLDSKRLAAFWHATGKSSPLFVDRSPDLFASYRTEGVGTRLLAASLKSGGDGELTGMAALSFKSVFINGQPSTAGYLGSLFVQPRDPHALRDGFRMIRDEASIHDAALCFTTIMEGNVRARRVLTSGRLGVPPYRSLGYVSTVVTSAAAIQARLGPAVSAAAALNSVSPEQVDEFLHSAGSWWQLFPRYKQCDLAGLGILPEARAEDGIVITRYGDIAAVGTMWNVSALKRWRLREAAGMSDVPMLFLTCRLTRPGDTDGIISLMRAAAEHAGDAKICYSVHSTDPFFDLLTECSEIRLQSELFQVECAPNHVSLDTRPIYVEAGAL